ncbi:MAG: TlpA disulfide reductase family protein [Nannocystaceae bacterium]
MISRRVTVAILASAAAAALGCRPPRSLPSPLWDEVAPELRGQAIDGRQIDAAALRGRVVVVEFFASYCEPCKRSLPALERLARRDRDVLVIAIGEDEALSKTRGMAEAFQLSMPVLHDYGNVLAGRYRVDGLPITFVVDEGGVIRWVGGAIEGKDLRRVIATVRR